MQSKDKGGEGKTHSRTDYASDLRMLRSQKEEFEKSNKLKIGDLNKRLVEKQQQFASGLMQVQKIKTDFEYKLGKAQLIAKLLEEEKRDSEEIMKKYIENAEAKYLVKVEDLRQRLEETNKKYEESRKTLMIKENEFETEKLLLEQKLVFTEKALASAKQRIVQQDRKLCSSSSSLKVQKSAGKVGKQDAGFYEEEISSLKEMLRDKETERLRLQETVNCLRERESIKIKSLEEQLNQEKARVRNEGALTAEVESWTMKYKQLSDEMQSVRQKLNSVERTRLKQVGDLKSQRNQLEKNNAIIRQQIEFSKAQVNELKARIQQLDKSSKTAEPSPVQNASSSESLRRIESMLEQQRSEFKLKEQDYLRNIKSLGIELQKAQKETNDKELQLAIQQRKYEQTIKTLEGYVASSKDIVKQLQNRLSSEDSNRMSVTNKYKVYYETKLQSLEQEVQRLRSGRQSSNNECHEQELTMIKNYYQQQKLHLENKISEEKERFSRSLQETVRELKQKHLQQIRMRQDNEQDLKCQLQEVWSVSSSKISELQSKLKLKEYELSNSLGRAQKIQQQQKILLEQSQMEFRKKQSQLQQTCSQMREKCQKLRTQVNQREKTVQQLSDQKEGLQRQLNRLSLEMADNEDRHMSQVRDLNLLIENGRHKYQQIFDESFFKQTQAQKRLALSEQSNRFNEQKIRELENTSKQQRKAYQKQLSQLKKELQTEGNERVEELKKELDRVAAKYAQLKRTAKENQIIFTKQLNDSKLTADLYAEKVRDLQLKIVELQKSSIAEEQKFKNSLLQLKSQTVEQRQRSALQVRRLQSQILEIENQKGLIEGEYEKDKILWSSKITFLESQKAQIKQDANEKIKRLEEAMEFLQRGKNERSLQSIPDAITNIERSYHVKLIEASDNYLRKQLQLQDKVKLLEVQLKLEQNKNIQSSVRGGSETYQKTIQSYRENQKRLSNEIQKLRLEKETLRIENSRLLNSEKDLCKQKIRQIEDKSRQAQTKRSLMMFEHEKEAAKWRQQKTMLKQNIQELEQQLSSIKLNNRKLEKENEQFRVDKRKHKISGSLVSSLTNSFASSVNRNVGAVRFDRFKGDNFKDYSIFGSPVQGSEHSQGSQNPHEDMDKPYEF